jgi:spermidine synthase
VLFATGLSSMGMEVVWVRQFTPYMGTMVYAFAIIVALYLAGTVAGSAAYRRWCAAAERPRPVSWLWPLLGLAGLLPLVASDPRLPLGPGLAEGAIRVAAGVVPLCALLGFLTPLLVDRWSGGDAERAGRAYAVNVLGCIVGPLVAGFVLLPHLGERASLALLAIALFACGRGAGPLTARRMPQRLAWAGATLLSVLLLAATRDFATRYPRAEVRRDHSATVIAAGEGWNRRLLVNGMGMTYLTPITKCMVHMPMAFLEEPPRRALVICFGMGTSFRSMLSWGVDATAVELVPSVPGLFSYFHEDGPELLRSPRAHVVIDDGRRFLERTPLQFDAITIDPPPPVEAAGSSLLYSREFYEVARERLRAGGILQQWVPNGDEVVIASFTRALVSSFRHVRAWGSVEGTGIHYLASDRPIPARTPAELARRLPPAAAADLVEWGPRRTAEEQFGVVLGRETPVSELLDLAPDVGPLTDDRAFNEYYLLRQRRR